MKRASRSAAVNKTAMDVVKYLAKHPSGVFADDFRSAFPRFRGEAVRLLREIGAPIVAQRAGHNTQWFLAPVKSALYVQWQERVLSDAYAEIVRAHAATMHHNPVAAGVFWQAAVNLGVQLGKTRVEVTDDLSPSRFMSTALNTVLSDGGYI